MSGAPLADYLWNRMINDPAAPFLFPAWYLLLKCFVLEHHWQPFSFFFFSSVPSQSHPLFTRGIIKHMAAMCLQCQIVRKE